MATTKTEQIVALLNYGLTTRQSTPVNQRRITSNYPDVLKYLVDIFANQAKKGNYTPEEISDFERQVSLVTVLNNRDNYAGLDRLPLYCAQMLDNLDLEKQSQIVR